MHHRLGLAHDRLSGICGHFGTSRVNVDAVYVVRNTSVDVMKVFGCD